MACASFRRYPLCPEPDHRAVFLILTALVSPMRALLTDASVRAVGATISGVVKDASGGVLAGASVEAVVAGRPIADDAHRRRRQLPTARARPRALRACASDAAGLPTQLVALPGHRRCRDERRRAAGRRRVRHAGRHRRRAAPESRATATQSVTVMTRADIEALGSASLADVIRFVPA